MLVLVASVPVQELGAAAGGQVTVTRLALVLAIGALAITLLVRRDALVLHRLIAPYTLLLVVMCASTIVASDMIASLSELSRWTIAWAAFVLAVQVFANASQQRLTALVVTLGIVGVLEATIGVIQSVLAAGPASFEVTDAFSRGFGTFGRPNTFAGFLEMCFFPCLWLGIYSATTLVAQLRAYARLRLAGMARGHAARGQLYQRAALSAGLLGASAAILAGIGTSFSRGAWLGTAGGLLVTTWLYHRRARILLIAAGSLLVLAALGGRLDVLPGTLNERLTSIVDEVRPFDASSAVIAEESFSTVERMAHWQAGWHMFRDHPALGVGVGNFNVRYDDYYVREEFRFTRGHAHNYYIHRLAETGIIGLSVYLSLIMSVGVLALRVVMGAPPGFERMLALGALGTIVAVAVHNVFENLHVLNMGITMSAIWTLVIAADRRWRASEALRGDTNMEYSRS
jgi:O-antigen ligase